MSGDVIKLRPRRTRSGGGTRQITWMCPSCPTNFNLAMHSPNGVLKPYRLDMSCPGCCAEMEMSVDAREEAR